MFDARDYVTRVSCDRPGIHEHVVTTHRRHLGLVVLAWQKSCHSVCGQECGGLQRPFMENSKHGDRRGVLHLPTQSVIIGPKQSLTQQVNVGEVWG